MRRLDLELVRHALRTARKHDYVEVEIDLLDDHFHAKLSPVAPAPAAPTKPEAAEPIAAAPGFTISSPAVGYFRPAENPLQLGTKIGKGDKIGAIVALGIANDVESNWSGVVSEIFVKSEQAVEYGQPLVRIET